MKLKRLLKRYENARKKASKLYEKIVDAYEEAYMDNDVKATQEIYNSIYNSTLTKKMKQILSSSHYGLSVYADTDSVKNNNYHVTWSNRTGNHKDGD